MLLDGLQAQILKSAWITVCDPLFDVTQCIAKSAIELTRSAGKMAWPKIARMAKESLVPSNEGSKNAKNLDFYSIPTPPKPQILPVSDQFWHLQSLQSATHSLNWLGNEQEKVARMIFAPRDRFFNVTQVSQRCCPKMKCFSSTKVSFFFF